MTRARDSAAYRIAFTYSAAFALATILLGAIVYFAAHAAFVRQLDRHISDVSHELVSAYRREGMGELREAITAREARGSSDELGYALFDAAGIRIAGSLTTPMPPAGWTNISFLDAREGPDPARAYSENIGGGMRLVVAADREALEAIDGTILALFGIAFVLVILIGIGGALLLGGYLRRRIGRIGATADAIISGDMHQRMPIGPRNDEFDSLSQTLNAMLDRIAALLDNLRRVSSDVAHDLRTPLARLRNRLERALTEPDDPALQREALHAAIDQTDDVLKLFAAILRISEVEGGGVRQVFATVDLSVLVTELCESYAPAVEDGRRTLDWTVEPGIAIDGDRELLAQAIINLLDNAQLHTPAGTSIGVALESGQRGIRLTVGDDGPGVAAADRERIASRFTRLEGSRSTPGHGLGLNLVSAIAAAHGARLEIADNTPGLAVSLVFPASATPTDKDSLCP